MNTSNRAFGNWPTARARLACSAGLEVAIGVAQGVGSRHRAGRRPIAITAQTTPTVPLQGGTQRLGDEQGDQSGRADGQQEDAQALEDPGVEKRHQRACFSEVSAPGHPGAAGLQMIKNYEL